MSSVTEKQQTAAQAKNKRRLTKKLTKGVLKLCLLLLIVVCLLVGFLLTPWGTKTVVNSASDLVDGLTIKYKNGGIGSDLHLSSVKWQQATTQVDIDNLRISMQLSCLWRLAVCIDSLSTDKMRVQIQPSDAPTESEPTTSAITLPVPVSVQNISLNKFSLQVQDTADIKWQKLTANLDFYQRLRIEKMQLDGFSVTTYASEKTPVAAQAEPFDWTKWQYQPIALLPVVLPIHFDVVDFKMSAANLHLAGQEPIRLKSLSLKAKGTKKKVQLDELQIIHDLGGFLAKGNVQLNGQLEHVLNIDANAQLPKLAPLKFTVRSLGNINSLSTQIELAEPALTTNAKADNSQTKPLKLSMEITAQLTKPALPIKMRVDWRQLKWPLVKPEVHSKTGLIDIQGDLNGLNMAVQTQFGGKAVPETKLNLEAVAESTAQNKRFELSKLAINTLGGEVISQGKLAFADYITWQGSTTISHIDPSVFWPELVGDINGVVSTKANNYGDVWAAQLSQLDIHGQWQGYPLSASGLIDYQQNSGVQLQNLTVKNAENTVLLSGNVSNQQVLDIKFVLDVADLSNSLPQLAGALNLTGNLAGTPTQPEVNYELSGSELMLANIFVEKLNGSGKIKWDQQKPMDITLNLLGIQGVNNQVDSAQLVLKGDANEHLLDVTTNGKITNVSLSIQGQLLESSWNGSWLTGDIESTYANLSLPEPFQINADWVKQQYLISPHCWRDGENELCIKTAEFKQNTAAWDISLKEFDVLSLSARLLPGMPKIQTKSRLNLDISGDWDLEKLPHANLKASLSAGSWTFSEQNNLQLAIDEVLVTAQMTPENIVANLNLSGSQFGSISASVDGRSGVYSDPLARPISGELLIEGFDFAAFKALAPQLDVLQGNINGQTVIGGTLGSPELTGELRLAKGALKDETLPVALSDIEQVIVLKGQSAEFAGSYKLGKGQGKMSGDLSWSPIIKGNLQIVGKELEFDYQSMIKASVSPDIKLMFEPNNIEITGEVTIPYARIKVRDLPKGSISPSKDVILVEKEAEQAASEQRLGLNVLLKLDPLRNNQVKLDAFGLTTDLQGQLRLQNNKSEIFGSGEVQLVNGRFRAYGQNLRIREGDIIFTNTLDRPFLNIEAIRDPDLTEDGVIAGIKVDGVAQNPTVSVFSEPTMEQQQTLSYILTGRGLGEGSSDSQETVLTNALLSLGLGQSENLVSKVGNKLGFEDVNFDTSGQGTNTQLSLTGTIAPGVQLRYGVGVFDSVSEVAIRYELLPKLYVEAVSGLSNAIDLYYQFSIEGKQNKQVLDD